MALTQAPRALLGNMALSVSFDASTRTPLPEESRSPDRKRLGESSLVAGAGVFGVSAGTAAGVG